MSITLIPISVGTSWYYSDLQAVQDLLGAANLSIGSDLEDTITGDAATVPLTDDQTALILRDGQDADSEFDLVLTGGAYTTPITVGSVALADLDVSNRTRRIFRKYSAMQVAIYLYQHRAIQTGPNSSMDAKAIDSVFGNYQKQVTDFLKAVRNGTYEGLGDESATDFSWRAGGAVGITQNLNSNDPRTLPGCGCRAPDQVPIWW